MKNDILVNLVVDASGSMAGWRRDTIEGINSLVTEQSESDDGRCFISTVVFNTEINPTAAVDVKSFGKFGTDDRPYSPDGGTALYDAVGVAIEGAEKWVENNGFNGKVVTVIWTDGMENSSRHFRQEAINRMIETKQEEGWVFQFLGSGEAAWRSAQQFTTINPQNVVRSAGTSEAYSGTYAALNSTILASRSGNEWNYDANA